MRPRPWSSVASVAFHFLLQTVHPLARYIRARAAHHRTQCPRTVSHHADTRGSRANTAQDCAVWCLLKDSVIPASCLIWCRTEHFFTISHALTYQPSHCPVWIKRPCEIHGGVADLLNLHLPRVMSPMWSNPTILRLELGLTGIL